MLAKVIAATTVHDIPRSIGEIVEVDETTFANLAKKGRLEAHQEAPEPEPETKETEPKKPKK